MMKIDPAALQKIMDEATHSGEECGCQLAIWQNGKKIVSLCSGWTAPDRLHPVTPQTMFPVFSCGKGLVDTVVNRLVEDGLLSYDTRIADVWPEFGYSGKENVRLWQILSHRTGLFDLPVERESDQGDWDLMCRKVQEMTPAYEPGTKCTYQALTYAWLTGGTVFHATGKTLQQWIRDLILDPLDLRYIRFGTTPEDDKIVAQVDTTHMDAVHRESWCAGIINSLPIRHSFLPSVNGYSNAEDLAKHYSSLLTETDGIRLLKPETVEYASTLCRWEQDPVDPDTTWEKFGMGYELFGKGKRTGYIFGHGGALGGEGLADKESGIALAFTKNSDLPSDPDHPIRTRLANAMGMEPRIW